MGELKPYRVKSDAPLTGGARFIRGFTRIGAVVAVLTLLTGIAITIFVGVDRYNSDVRKHEDAMCVTRLARAGWTFKKKYDYSSDLDYSVGGCSGWSLSYQSLNDVIAMADAPAPMFLSSEASSILGWGLVITGGLAVVAYLAFWCIGWVFAGFTRDA
ncbi:hypothetical protein [Bradyrhizobium sp. LB11.1]|uniref:hypothetical protein n=1 Tax=Bradyrhizobium sp. LB11.1 TaxID=3156326 RepID=UPI00339A7D8F